MRGLLEKDIRLTMTRKQSFLVFLVVALIMGLSIDGSFVIGYLTMLAVIMAMGTISYDEYDNGFAFLMTLPFERKTYVREKYVFSLIMAVLAWAAGAILYAIMSLISGKTEDLTDQLSTMAGILPVISLTATFMIPLQLKYGGEKSRIVLFIIFGVIAVAALGASKVIGGTVILEKMITTLEGFPIASVLGALAAVCVLALFISYLCSVRIMEKKEC